jgi:hypothetical protein
MHYQSTVHLSHHLVSVEELLCALAAVHASNILGLVMSLVEHHVDLWLIHQAAVHKEVIGL